MVKKVLITGGSGLLGRYLINSAPSDYELHATYNTNDVSKQCSADVHWHRVKLGGDGADRRSLVSLFEAINPDIVIHTAAIGSVDYCEKNRIEALEVNFIGSLVIADLARRYHTKMIHVSTNAVYEGGAPPYTQDSSQMPVNYYGHVKSMTERNFTYEDVFIIRPIMLYGWPWEGGRPNWATITINQLKKNGSLRIVGDTLTQPTYAADCADFIWYAISADLKGSVNFATRFPTTLHDFAREVAKEFDLDPYSIGKASSADFPNIAPRPVDTTYLLNDTFHTGYIPLDASGIIRMKNERH